MLDATLIVGETKGLHLSPSVHQVECAVLIHASELTALVESIF